MKPNSKYFPPNLVMEAVVIGRSFHLSLNRNGVNIEGYNGVVLMRIRPTKKVGPCIYIGVERLMKINSFFLIIYECNFRY